MSSITTDQGIVHYEVYGRGRPVILLHGWLGSWGLWQETMVYLGAYYRTYALDFWGFGESGKKRDSYSVQDFVSLVDQFMDRLGIERAPLVGHSMGGTVSLSVASQFPRRVSKVAVVGHSGSGKSTLARLLFRFYDVTGGTLRLDGHDIRTLDLSGLRRQFGIVLQEPLLFNVSIADNIRYARPGATIHELITACRRSSGRK